MDRKVGARLPEKRGYPGAEREKGKRGENIVRINKCNKRERQFWPFAVAGRRFMKPYSTVQPFPETHAQTSSVLYSIFMSSSTKQELLELLFTITAFKIHFSCSC